MGGVSASLGAVSAHLAEGFCPCLGREKVELLPSDDSGTVNGHGWCVAQNQRQRMEDAVDVDVPGPKGRLFAVYDGHGGTAAVEYAKEELPKFMNKKREEDEAMEDTFRQSFEDLDQGLQQHLVPCTVPGSTAVSSGLVACVAWCTAQQVVIANVGDCRAVKCSGGKYALLTTDHRPSESQEHHRLVSQNLEVDDGYMPSGLAVSRAFGNFQLKDGVKCEGLICQPDIFTVDVTEDLEFILLASDGVFESMTAKDVADECRQVGLSARRSLRQTRCPKSACEVVVREAKGRGSIDNISAVIITFTVPAAEKRASGPRKAFKLSFSGV